MEKSFFQCRIYFSVTFNLKGFNPERDAYVLRFLRVLSGDKKRTNNNKRRVVTKTKTQDLRTVLVFEITKTKTP